MAASLICRGVIPPSAKMLLPRWVGSCQSWLNVAVDVGGQSVKLVAIWASSHSLAPCSGGNWMLIIWRTGNPAALTQISPLPVMST